MVLLLESSRYCQEVKGCHSELNGSLHLTQEIDLGGR